MFLCQVSLACPKAELEDLEVPRERIEERRRRSLTPLPRLPPATLFLTPSSNREERERERRLNVAVDACLSLPRLPRLPRLPHAFPACPRPALSPSPVCLFSSPQ